MEFVLEVKYEKETVDGVYINHGDKVLSQVILNELNSFCCSAMWDLFVDNETSGGLDSMIRDEDVEESQISVSGGLDVSLTGEEENLQENIPNVHISSTYKVELSKKETPDVVDATLTKDIVYVIKFCPFCGEKITIKNIIDGIEKRWE